MAKVIDEALAKAHPQDVEDSDDEEQYEEDTFLDILATKICQKCSDSSAETCTQLCTAYGIFCLFVTGVGTIASAVWLFIEVDTYNTEINIYNAMDPDLDFERIQPGCTINFTRHEYLEVIGAHNHMTKMQDPSRCYDSYFYTITDLSSGGEWDSAAQSSERKFADRYCHNSVRANSSFAGTLPTDIVSCWRAKHLPAPEGYVCGNEACIKINDPAIDYAARVPFEGNKDNASNIFVPCLLASLLLWLLLSWGPERCDRMKRCQCRG
jgi:hypothetical protein